MAAVMRCFNHEALVQARTELGLTQEQAAAEVGVDVRTYRRYESGAVNQAAKGFIVRNASRRRFLVQLSRQLGIAEKELVINVTETTPRVVVQALTADQERAAVLRGRAGAGGGGDGADADHGAEVDVAITWVATAGGLDHHGQLGDEDGGDRHGAARAGSASRDDACRCRLRTAFAAGHALLPLIGLPHRGLRPAVRLQDVCVPLRMYHGESVEPWTVLRLVGHLLSLREPAPRVVVLGAPGSGKSTLCQYLTVLLGGGVRNSEFEIPEVVPLTIRLRDFAARRDSLLQYVHDRAEALGVGVDIGVLARVCDEGRAVLIIDGFDEIGDDAARTGLRDRLLAFLSLHPRVPVLISTREVGYDEVPLPGQGADAFLRLKMAPLDDEEIGTFVERWYAAIEPDIGVDARGAAADLTATILATPAIRALAEKRLLLTLIALIHHQDARLPGERTALFERCMRLFLETWPRQRSQEFTAISSARQRRLLETLAAAMIGHWEETGCEALTMTRDGLVAALMCYSRADDPSVEDGEISAWIDHLYQESGVLVEVGVGIFQFVHRSLQEYLAACWYARSSDDPVGLIVRSLIVGSDHDREVWLMLAGLCAAERARADDLFRRVREDVERCYNPVFLLECLREGVDFSAEQAAAILTGMLYFPSSYRIEKDIAHILRFSERHRESVRAWFARGLREGPLGPLPELVWAAAAAMPVNAVLADLDVRNDRAAAAATIAASLWPLGQHVTRPVRPELDALGHWAWSNVDLGGSLALFGERRVSAAELRSAAVMVLQAGIVGPIVAALTLRLALDALGLAHATATSPAWREVMVIAVEPGGWTLPTGIPPPIAGVSVAALCVAATVRLRRWTYPHGRFDYLGGQADPRWDECLSENLARGDIAGTWPESEWWPRIAMTDSAGAWSVPPPDAGRTPGLYDAWLIDLPEPEPKGPADFPSGLHALHSVHGAIAARSFADDRALAVLATEIRLQSVWVLQTWNAVEEAAPANTTALALVLALGWTQCLTTGTWPGTPRWRALLAGPPPAHWWPRLHWHLCWLTARPEADEHRAALRAACAEGADDPEFGALAKLWMCAVVGRPLPMIPKQR